MSSTVRILSSRERVVFFSFLFSCLCVTDCFSLSPILFIIYYCEYIYSPHRTKITSDVGRAGFHWKGKREKQRTALLCLFTSIPISTQKMVPEKSQQQMSLLKKKPFASQPAQSLLRCQDGKFIIWGSEWSSSNDPKLKEVWSFSSFEIHYQDHSSACYIFFNFLFSHPLILKLSRLPFSLTSAFVL